MTAFANENTTVTTGPIDGSAKAYLAGPDGVDVAVRRIGLTNDTTFDVYDTSGPYTDDAVTIDVHAGLAPRRAPGSTRAAAPSSSGPAPARSPRRCATSRSARASTRSWSATRSRSAAP
jgi:hypothetical protein